MGPAGRLPNNPFSTINGINTIINPDGTYVQVLWDGSQLSLRYYDASNDIKAAQVFYKDDSLGSTLFKFSTFGGLASISTANHFDSSNNLTYVTENFTENVSFTNYVKSQSDVGVNDTTNLLTENLTTYNGQSVGTLTFDPSNGAIRVTLLNGVVITPPNNSNPVLNSPAPNATPLETLQGYLTDLGASVGNLTQLNFDYLHPAGTAHAVTGSVSPEADYQSATATFTADAPGATITGMTDATLYVPGHYEGTNYVPAGTHSVPVTSNILALSDTHDISRDTVTGIDTLDTRGGVTLTHAQFAGFTTITGGGAIVAADGGLYSLADTRLDHNDSTWTGLVATGWDGTTLIGNNDNASPQLYLYAA